MSFPKFTRFGMAGLLIVGVLGVAFAQDGAPGADKVTICHNNQTIEIAASALPAHRAHGDTEGACGPSDETAGMTRKVNLSPEEQVKTADETLSGMDTAAKNVRTQLEKAREQRDVVKALCLSDKLTQINVARKSAGERADAHRQAVARQDKDLATHEFTILMVLKERVDQLSAEANQCIGVEAGFVGESAVTVEIDPNLPTQDPSEYPPDDPIILQPPSCVSCIQ